MKYLEKLSKHDSISKIVRRKLIIKKNFYEKKVSLITSILKKKEKNGEGTGSVIR